MRQGPLCEKLLLKLAEQFGDTVLPLSIQLGLSSREVQNIRMSNPYDAVTWGFQALVRWQDNLADALGKKETLDALKNVFKEADRNDLVELADEPFEPDETENSEKESPSEDKFKMAANKARANIDAMSEAHREELRQKDKMLRQKDEMLRQKDENLREAEDDNNKLQKAIRDNLADQTSNNNQPSILVAELPKEVLAKHEAYGCACSRLDCLRCQVVEAAETALAKGTLCQKRQAKWQERITAIRHGTRTMQQWRDRWACSACHTVECLSKQWNTNASFLALLEQHPAGSSDVTLRADVVVVYEAAVASGQLCQALKPAWQRHITRLTQQQVTPQQLVNEWKCSACGSAQCHHQSILLVSKLYTTIVAMAQ